MYLQNAAGQPFPVKVVEKDETTITFDANHEMAGKELNFTIELVSSRSKSFDLEEKKGVWVDVKTEDRTRPG